MGPVLRHDVAGDTIVTIEGHPHYGDRVVDEVRTYNPQMSRVWFTDGTSTGPLHPKMSVAVKEGTTKMFKLHDTTKGETWEYDTERQLKTVTRLYAIQHPTASLSVTINGITSKVR